MPDKDRKKRKPPISYRPPAALRDEFHARVEKSGLSASAFITKAIFNQAPPRQSRRPALQQRLLARLLSEAARIRQDLDDIARQDGYDGGSDPVIAEATRTLTEIRAALLKAMGRNP